MHGYLFFCHAQKNISAAFLPLSVSVIIPVLNESRRIAACVELLFRDKAVTEVIVVDGGSVDDTVSLAAAANALVIRHTAPPENGGGRGGQIHAGVMKATGDVIAVVHADTRVTAPTFSCLLDMLRKNPSIVGGAVGSVFNGGGARLRLLEFANDLRAVCMGISFGDQVQFFRRKPVLENDLYPNIPLMEDIELSLRLPRIGRTAFLLGNARVSARRWQTGASQRAGLIIWLFTVYLWKRLWGKADTLAMYRQYYP